MPDLQDSGECSCVKCVRPVLVDTVSIHTKDTTYSKAITFEGEHSTQALAQAHAYAPNPTPHHLQQAMLQQRNGTTMGLVSETLEHMVGMHALTTLLM